MGQRVIKNSELKKLFKEGDKLFLIDPKLSDLFMNKSKNWDSQFGGLNLCLLQHTRMICKQG